MSNVKSVPAGNASTKTPWYKTKTARIVGVGAFVSLVAFSIKVLTKGSVDVNLSETVPNDDLAM